MTRSLAFRPTVMMLENRWLPTVAIYPNPILDEIQAYYVSQAEQADNPVVFLGDSITFNWGRVGSISPGTSVFTKDFVPLGAANFGIYGDNTDNVIARIQGGDLAGQPKVVVLMIGFNNLYQGQTAQQAASGVAGVVQAIKTASPTSTILLLGVLPSNQAYTNPRIQELDTLIASLGDEPGVVYMNPGAEMVDASGMAQPGLFIDGVHPDLAGYTIIANAIDGTLVKLLGENEFVADHPLPVAPSSQAPSSAVVSMPSSAVVSTPTSPVVAMPSSPVAAAPSVATSAAEQNFAVVLPAVVSTDTSDDPAVVLPIVISTNSSGGAVVSETPAKAKSLATELITVTTS